MKCLKCGTENEGNICVKCGSHLYDNNLENSIFFKNIGDSIKSIENSSKEIMQEKKDNFNNENKIIIEEQNNILNSKLVVPKEKDNTLLSNKDVLQENLGAIPFEKDNNEKPNLEIRKQEEIKSVSNNGEIISNDKDINKLNTNNKKDNFNNENKIIIEEQNNILNSKLIVPKEKDNTLISNEGVLQENLDLIPEESTLFEKDNNEKLNLEIKKQEEIKSVSNNGEIISNDKDINKLNTNNKKDKRKKFIKNKQNITINYLEKSDLEIFIGKNAEKLIFNKINIIPAILGNIWLLYRKYYLAGIILSILEFLFVLYVIFLTNTPIYVYFILRFILYLLVGKEMYINYAKTKIKKIKEKNSDITKEQEIELLQKAGGTNKKAPIIYMVVIIFIFVSLFLFIYNLGSYTFYEMDLKAKNWSLNGNDGLIYGDSKKTCIVDIKYGTTGDENILSKLYEKGIITEEQYLNKLEYNFDELDKEVINGIEWSKLTIIDANNIYEDVMVTIKNDALYFVNFKGYNTNDYNLCQEKFIDLKSTIKFK